MKKIQLWLAGLVILAVLPLIGACGGSGAGGNSNSDDASEAQVAHADLTWDGTAGACLACHRSEALDMYGTTHYQWQGAALYMTNGPAIQGKIGDAVNSYCINILGNWETCGNCHVGLGDQPVATSSPNDTQLSNIDCLVCHQKAYKRIKSNGRFVPDTATMTITLDQAVQTVHRPERAGCLHCHAKAGGGDAVKRGDLALASASTHDDEYDVHMAVSGGNLSCQSCHTFSNHRVAGKGSDIRPTDLDQPVACTQCHTDKASLSGHDNRTIGRHVARVACQTCHIPHFAKDAADTLASEATETHRTWLDSPSSSAPFHPDTIKANNLIPQYRFWNRYSDNYLLGGTAELDPDTGAYPTSRPEGSVVDVAAANKLHAFKYKTAIQPIMDGTGQLIALDTKVFFETADAAGATRAGLRNMGLDENTAYSWVTTDTFQLLNHQVSPSDQALGCTACHGTTARMDLQGELGYALNGPTTSVCIQCHSYESPDDFYEIHEEHVAEENIDCSRCHGFSRPER